MDMYDRYLMRGSGETKHQPQGSAEMATFAVIDSFNIWGRFAKLTFGMSEEYIAALIKQITDIIRKTYSSDNGKKVVIALLKYFKNGLIYDDEQKSWSIYNNLVAGMSENDLKSMKKSMALNICHAYGDFSKTSDKDLKSIKEEMDVNVNIGGAHEDSPNGDYLDPLNDLLG